MVKVRKDLTGQTFGKLTVIKQVDDYITPKGKHNSKWLCECSCSLHRLVEVCGSDLKKKNGTKSCGECPKDKVVVKEDLVGRVFGRLTVIEQTQDLISKNERHIDQWLCKCECGNNTVVTGANLKNKNGTRSCGCLAIEKLIERNAKKNSYELNEEYGVGYTNNTNAEFYFSLEDFETIKIYCWHEIIAKTGYHTLKAWDTELQKEITMAELLGCKNYDHANRNTLDNRRENLRPATLANNAQNRTKQRNNTSGFIGVCWNKNTQLWVARIGLNGKNKNLGSFNNKEDAIRVRLEAEAKYYGEFAPQRNLFEEYEISIVQN